MMDLMDLALKYKDYEWAKELAGQRELPEVSNPEANEKAIAEVFIEEKAALEDIFNTYAVEEKAGIRSFNINSEFDRNNSDVVIIEKMSYKKGEKVRYKIPTSNELNYIRGMVNGYLAGYEEANKVINRQMVQFYEAVTAQTPKSQSTNAGKKKKVQTKNDESKSV